MISIKNAGLIFAVIVAVLVSTTSTSIGKGAPPPIPENSFISQVKADLDTFELKRPEDRVYLMFDKPFYYPGETIWFQAYVRNGADMKPSKMSDILYVEFIAPSGNIDKKLTIIARNGTGSGNISLENDMSGGLYKIKAYTKWQENDKEPAFYERDIQIQRVVLPTLKMKLEFEREAYGKGDEVKADLAVETLANEPLKNIQCPFIVKIKGKTILEKTIKTDKKGFATILFSLPQTLDSADGLLNVMIPYQGKTESISRSVPIILNNLNIDVFPEGGDMVAGFSSKVAVRVLDEFGKPADIRGVVETKAGKRITDFNTFHQGLGSFNLKPKAGEDYFIKVVRPAGIADRVAIPEALPRGYTLGLKVKNNKKIDIIVKSTEIEDLAIVAKSRGKLIKSFSFKAKKGENRFTTDTNDFPMGVVMVTLFDSKKIERAERLVFVNSDKKMTVRIKTDKEKYLPREKVKMSIRVFDERELPLPAQLSISVADDKLISFADVKEGNILSKLLLEPDLKTKIHEPDFYFDDKEEKAGKAMDLLMLTHGWRRFVWKDVFKADQYAPEHASEKAVINGIVMSERYGGKPVVGAIVKTLRSGKTVTTDLLGRFVFRDIDLYEGESFIATKDKQSSGSAYISNYNSHVTLYLQKRRVRKRMLPQWFARPKNAAPPMVERGMAMDDAMVVEEAAPPELMEAPMDEPLMAMAVEEKADPVVKMNMVVEEEMEVLEDIVADKRMMKKKIRVMQEQVKDAPVYYRARAFPKTVYQSTKREQRTDFRSTIFWQGNIETDRKGKAEIEFYNSDEITTFRSIVEGIGVDGLVGRNESLHYTQLPFSMDVKIPVEVTMGDSLLLPLTIVNNSTEKIEGVLTVVPPASWKKAGSFPDKIVLAKGDAKTVYLPFDVLNVPGEDVFRAEFKSGNDTDAFKRPVTVAPKGFPVSVSISGQEKTKAFSVNISKPVAGTIKAKFTAYPTVLSDLLKGIESILREPYGCFEQTSSSTYPNIMVMQYMHENDHKDNRIMKKAGDLIEKGYKRLASFETKDKGYEWFGATPPHEALTAYGLMEFKDMQTVFGGVDDGMIKRTGSWLLAKRDGEGGFTRSKQALDSFGRASEEITNAYIVYSLSEAGFIFEIKKELEKACENAEKSDDPYQLGLVSNALFNVKDNRADKFLAKLMKHQQADGSWTGKVHSVTCSTGVGLKVETTALAILASLKSDKKDGQKLTKGVKFILGSRSSYGGFGNTQSTVLALKSLVAYTKFSRKTAESGTIEIYINGQKAGSRSYEAGETDEIVIPEETLSNFFQEGKFKVEIRYKKAKNPLPYTFAINYSTDKPNASDKCDVNLTTSFNAESLKTGGTVRLTTTLTNLKKEDGLPMTIAIIGIPGGLSPQPWQLKELQEKKTVDYYEVTGSNVVLYYRQMKPGETREINLDLKGEIPGTFTGAASSAYLYYTNEFKTWVGGNSITIEK